MSSVFEYLPVLTSQDVDIELSKAPCAAVVSFDLQQVGLHGSIEFDHNAIFRTIKVDNVRTYPVSTAKLFPVQFRAAKCCPQESFGGCGMTPELAMSIFQIRATMDRLAPLHGSRSEQFYDLPSRRVRGAAQIFLMAAPCRACTRSARDQEGMPQCCIPQVR